MEAGCTGTSTSTVSATGEGEDALTAAGLEASATKAIFFCQLLASASTTRAGVIGTCIHLAPVASWIAVGAEPIGVKLHTAAPGNRSGKPHHAPRVFASTADSYFRFGGSICPELPSVKQNFSRMSAECRHTSSV